MELWGEGRGMRGIGERRIVVRRGKRGIRGRERGDSYPLYFGKIHL